MGSTMSTAFNSAPNGGLRVKEAPAQRIDVQICNRKGLHARASAKFVKCAEQFEAEVRVTRGHETVGGTSIMGLMMLAAGIGTTITIEAEGVDAAQALAALTELVANRFGEDD
jgi:phosphocarrier protein HPr